MAQKKSYSRYFIILQEDEKGYSLSSDKVASGYAKLETKNDKCKISYYVQNLKKEATPYYMMLVCNKKDVKKIIKVGEMNIDDYGRADVCYEYSVNDVADSGVPMDKVSGAAIVRLLDNNIISVMSGFASTEIPEWKSFPLIENKSREAKVEKEAKAEKEAKVEKETKAEKADETQNKSIFDKYEESIEMAKQEGKKNKVEKACSNEKDTKKLREDDPQKESKEANESEGLGEEKEVFADEDKEVFEDEDKKENIELKNREESIRDSVEDSQEHSGEDLRKNQINTKIKEDMEADIKDENYKEDSKNEVYLDSDFVLNDKEQETSKVTTESYKEELETLDYVDSTEELMDYPRGSVGGFFNSLTDGFEKMPNICKDIKRSRWYKVPVKSIEDMYDMRDYNKYTVIYNPMIGYYPYIKKYCHYVTGYKCDKRGNVKYLIYGIPGTKSKKDQPYGGKTGFVTWVPSKKKDKSGYWIMFYDFRTCTIVIPVRK